MATFCSKEFTIEVGELGLGSLVIRGLCKGVPIISGESVAHLVTGTGAVPPYVWEVDGPGEAALTAAALTLNVGVDDGEGGEQMEIVGTPSLTTAGGPINFTVTVTDEAVPANVAVRTYSLYIADITDDAGALPPAAIGQPYTHELEQTGAAEPVQWEVTTNLAGFLAAGFSLDPGTGEITGTSLAAGTITFTISLTSASI